jgi:outer membrane protein TolC
MFISGSFAGRMMALVTNAARRSPLPLLLLAGCIHYAPKPVDVSESARLLAARTIDAPAVRALVAPGERWTPRTLALAAVALHPDLDVARADWAAARAAIRTAAERPNPALTAGVEHKDGTSPWVTTLSLDLPIETAGKRGARVQQARATSAAAAADLDQQVWNVRTRAATAAVDLAASERLSQSRRAEVRLREEIVAMMEKRLAVGEASQPEVTRVRADDRAARLLLGEEEGRAAERGAALAAAIGIPRSALPPPDIDLPAPPPIGEENRLRELALTTRPDILAALARYDAADAALRLAVRQQYPDLHIAPGLGWDQGAFKWTLSVAGELPLFNRHAGAIAEADARRDSAAAQVLAAQARVLGQLEGALARERSARLRVEEAARLVAAKETLAAAARRQFEKGEIDRLALRNQELEIALAELDRWTALFDLQRAVVEVEAAVEQPLGGTP